MTNNEIIKAWEWHISPVHCNGMKIYSTVVECSRELAENTFDLINRKTAEIEMLNKRIAGQKHALFEQQSYTAELQNELKTAKSEAIKEFARELKCGVPQETGIIRCIDVDNLLKKMVGDDNAVQRYDLFKSNRHD